MERKLKLFSAVTFQHEIYLYQSLMVLVVLSCGVPMLLVLSSIPEDNFMLKSFH